MNHSSYAPFAWRGRVDAQEAGPSERWHQRMRPFDAGTRGGVVLLGFAVDEGVRRNDGRPGAAAGPQALRAALANMPVLGETALADAGDVRCQDGQLEAAQSQLARSVAQVVRQHALPLVLGGGHEMAWGTFQGLVQALQAPPTDAAPRNILIVNLDAHFDLRQAAEANSGTPFRQMQEWCTAHGQAFNYQVFGISRFANTRALFTRADTMGVQYWMDEALQDPAQLEQACTALDLALSSCDAAYLTVCLDVLPAEKAPGVSAPAALGVPLAHVERLIDRVAASGRLRAADIAELNPAFDQDGRTARVAARIAARIARQYAQAVNAHGA